jgi:hypothetical protein
MIVPPVSPTPTAKSATLTEICAAKIVRESTSRPTSSVPSQWVFDGLSNMTATSRSYGEYGAIHGAKTAERTTTETMTASSVRRPCRLAL